MALGSRFFTISSVQSESVFLVECDSLENVRTLLWGFLFMKNVECKVFTTVVQRQLSPSTAVKFNKQLTIYFFLISISAQYSFPYCAINYCAGAIMMWVAQFLLLFIAPADKLLRRRNTF